VAKDLPFLLALSASSPFWHGAEHRLRQHPHDHLAALADRGATGPLASAADYDALLGDLMRPASSPTEKWRTSTCGRRRTCRRSSSGSAAAVR
jgi:hypothetical protein